MSGNRLTILKNEPDKKWYQTLARDMLPILVRQAMACQKISYGDLGKELGQYHLILRHPLDCIGETLSKLGEEWQEEIPPIQGLVVDQKYGLPGDGVHFLRDQKLDPRQKEAIVQEKLGNVFSYPRWLDVLEALGLSPAAPLNTESDQPADHQGSTGESEEHKQLKDYVARHPESIGLGKSLAPGQKEFRLPSGDRIDVLFQNTKRRIAVEVKSRVSDEADLKRGLFQCVKYRAILRACRSLDTEAYEVDALLVLEDSLPKELIPVRNTLGVKVVENIRIK